MTVDLTQLFPIIGIIILIAIFIHLLMLLIYQLRQISATEQLQKQELSALIERSQHQLKTLDMELLDKRGAWRGLRKFEISKIVIEDQEQSIRSFYLTPHDKRPLPPFRPGQFLTFHLSIEKFQDTVRCYSLSDAPGDPNSYRVSIKKIPAPKNRPELPPGLSSNYFHHLSGGSYLDIEAPSGDFHLDTNNNGPVVLIGGGIGLTPVYSMLRYIAKTNPERETWFFYGVRNSNEHIWETELNKLRKHENIHIVICYSNPLDGDQLGKDYDINTRVNVDLFKEKLTRPNHNYHFYLCGPPPMMKSIVTGLNDWSVPSEQIHYEAFGPASIMQEEKPLEQRSKESYTIEFVRSGKNFTWDGSDNNLWDFAQKNGIVLPKGCGAGNCGQCKTGIVSGEVHYPRKPSKRVEKNACLVCCSTPMGELKLDA